MGLEKGMRTEDNESIMGLGGRERPRGLTLGRELGDGGGGSGQMPGLHPGGGTGGRWEVCGEYGAKENSCHSCGR